MTDDVEACDIGADDIAAVVRCNPVAVDTRGRVNFNRLRRNDDVDTRPAAKGAVRAPGQLADGGLHQSPLAGGIVDLTVKDGVVADKLSDEGRVRPRVELVRRADLFDAALVHDDDAIR
ncbi:hypothetical protein D9M68_399490 [compost metagenome]